MRIAFIGSAVVAALLFAACDGDNGTEPVPTETPLAERATSPPDGELSPTSTETPLAEQDAGSTDLELFVLVGGGPFRVCVQTLDDSVSFERAASTIEAGFEDVARQGHWPRGWETPAVDRGCPLPPLALTETDKPFLERRVCLENTSGYLVHLYVGDAGRFKERFVDARLRAVPHEYLAVRRAENVEGAAGGAQCFGWVALAWYVTPDELEDGLLADYVSNFVRPVHEGPPH